MRLHRTLVSAALAVALGVTGCGDEGAAPAGDTTALTVLLTDEPGDISAAVVTISRIYLQGGQAEEDGDGSVVLMSEPTTVDLLTLQSDFQPMVDGQTVAAGSYGQLRFVIDGAYIEVEGEAEGQSRIFATDPDYAGLPEGALVDGVLMCPSCGQSGLKVDFAGPLVLDEASEEILVDFDVSETFGREAGASGRWVMNPLLKATEFGAAANVSVSLTLAEGVSLPLLEGATVALDDFRAELTGASGDVETAAFVQTATGAGADFGPVLIDDAPYTLRVVVPAGLTVDVTPSVPMTVDLSGGSSETVELTVTGVAVAAVGG